MNTASVYLEWMSVQVSDPGDETSRQYAKKKGLLQARSCKTLHHKHSLHRASFKDILSAMKIAKSSVLDVLGNATKLLILIVLASPFLVLAGGDGTIVTSVFKYESGLNGDVVMLDGITFQ